MFVVCVSIGAYAEWERQDAWLACIGTAEILSLGLQALMLSVLRGVGVLCVRDGVAVQDCFVCLLDRQKFDNWSHMPGSMLTTAHHSRCTQELFKSLRSGSSLTCRAA